MPCAKRDVFIDNQQNEENIKNRLQELAKISKEKGFAVGIGHCRKKTLEVLKTEIPKLQMQGYEFVFASEVVR